MNKKIGRNDPCPCGSGKKYKSCCMHKEQEQSAAKYTASGKRKFKAKVLNATDKTASIFGQAATTEQEVPSESATLEKLKFKMAEKDFQKESEGEALKFEGSEEAPEPREQQYPDAEEEFDPTSEDFREKK